MTDETNYLLNRFRTEESHGAPLELQQGVRREVGRQHRTHTLPTTQGDTKGARLDTSGGVGLISSLQLLCSLFR